MITSMFKHDISIIRNNNVVAEVKSSVQGDTVYLAPGTDIEINDLIKVKDPNYKESYVVKKVIPVIHGNSPGNHIKLKTVTESENIIEEKNYNPSITQNFNGNVTNVAGRDINNNITIHLQALHKIIENNKDIPSDEKNVILSTIEKLLNNKYVSNISSGTIAGVLSNLMT